MSRSLTRRRSLRDERAEAAFNLQLPTKFQCLFAPARYKIFHGGRGSAKSWSVAKVLVLLAATCRLRILCAREYQSSINDSVHRLLVDQIYELKLQRLFTITKTSISCPLTGSSFLFKGLASSIAEIKSTEGIDIVWVEEAQSTSKYSWEVLIPTIRKDYQQRGLPYDPNHRCEFVGCCSEIWVTFNPFEEADPTYQGFVVNQKPDSFVVQVNWEDNPWFPETLEKERRYLQSIDLDAYDHIWGGNPKTITDAIIFGRRTKVECFETPSDIDRFFYGADWGFAQDPTALVRSFIKDETLFIDHEAFGFGVELDDLPALFDTVPGARQWPIKADSARPETISYMRRQGFTISGAEKWEGSVEDGITHLKGFRHIVIHERCKHMNDERRLYRYKVDKKTGQVLPVIVDKHNHGWDSIRYSLDGYIQKRGSNNIWARLAQ